MRSAHCPSGRGRRYPLYEMRCEEKLRLQSELETAVQHYSATVSDLSVSRGKTSVDEYKLLMTISEQARAVSKKARLNFERHLSEHGADRAQATRNHRCQCCSRRVARSCPVSSRP